MNLMIEPYVAVGQLELGKSTQRDCREKYGEPIRTRKNREGISELCYDEIIVRFEPTSGTLRECTVLPRTDAAIRNLNVTWDREFLRKACVLDGSPVELYGFIVMNQLGIAVTGIHDDDESQLALTVFSRGEFDGLMKDAKVFDASTL